MYDVIEAYLTEQQDLTAVEKFTLHHDFRQRQEGQKSYQELIPKRTPGPGRHQQYAFEVNLDQCSGCKACVTACHRENGLDEGETWRSVGLLLGGTSEGPVIQHVTGACHHCLDPACLNGCPVNAYEKDEQTGIVKHLGDQCFGCQYCTFTCPYDVPKYNKKKGIVHKCDMCIGRLKVGEAPACVRACPSSAIRVTLVDTEAVRKNPGEYVRIPDAPDSKYTYPTTRYFTQKRWPGNTTSMDFYSLNVEHSHLPLVAMLVLTQLAVGVFGAGVVVQHYLSEVLRNVFTFFHWVALGMGVLAMGASVFHLGRPLYAFRAVLGLRRSWLSREIVAFGLFALMTAYYAFIYRKAEVLFGKIDIFAFATAVMGLLGVFCSVRVYKVTHRPFWDNEGTTIKFFMTSVLLGVATMLLTSAAFLNGGFFHQGDRQISLSLATTSLRELFCIVLMAATSIKLVVESTAFYHLGDRELTSSKKTALLMTGPLKKITWIRFTCGLLGGVVGPVVLLGQHEHMGPAAAIGISGSIFLFLLMGEFWERCLFFRAVVPLAHTQQLL